MNIPRKHIKIFEIIKESVNVSRNRTKKDINCYLVGGYVRDYLLDKEPKDIDCTCNHIDDILSDLETILNREGIKFTKQVYQAFGTRLYHFLGENVEFVLPRKESYRDYTNRNPEIKEGTFQDDAFRRDFTLNAIYLSLNPEDYLETIDLTGRGIMDLKKGLLDTPLDPDITFEEDPLRMLRLARFYAVKGFLPSKRVVESCKKNAKRLSIIVPERIVEEITKSMVAPKYFSILYELGLLFVIFPDLEPLEGLEQRKDKHKHDVLTHALLVTECLPLKMRLAGLYHDAGKIIIKHTGNFHEHEKLSVEIADKRFRTMKFPNDIIKYTLFIIKNHMRLPFLISEENVSDKSIRRFLKEFGKDTCDLITFLRCDTYGSGMKLEEREQKLNSFIEKMENINVSCPIPQKLDIDGNDVIQFLGLKKGDLIVGKILKELMQKVVDQELINEKHALFDYIDQMKKS